MKGNFAGPPILKYEMIAATKKIKNGKTTGPDSMSVELIEALGDFGLAEVTELLTDIYDTGHIPSDMLKSVFIALPKKAGATDCELHRTISLMSHVTKILLHIIMMRVRNEIKPEIAEEQCGFVEGKGTSNAILKLRTLTERFLEVNKDVCLCFIDYTKAIDRVRHDDLVRQLTQFKGDGKDLRIIKNMHSEQRACMKASNDFSSFKKIQRGVRQGCVLFSLYSENTLRLLKDFPGIKFGGKMINNLRYADDTVLTAENEKELQILLDIVVKGSHKKGLELNCKKTEVMVVSQKAVHQNATFSPMGHHSNSENLSNTSEV